MIGKTNSMLIKKEIFTLLPEDYQAVEFIESDGLSYIDTELKSHSNMSCELQFVFTTVPSDGCIVGARHTAQQQGVGKSRLYFYHYYNGHKLGYGMYLGRGQATQNLLYNIRTRLDVGHQYMYINGELAFEGFDEYEINNEETFYIFALHDGDSTTFYSKARLYYCKIWDGDNLVRQFIPTYRKSDNMIGLYDTINQCFHPNKGNGTFIKGNDADIKNIISNITKV